MHKYFLGLKELDDEIGGIGGGTNIMLIGPAMSGKTAVLNSIMSDGLHKGDAVILVETRVPGADALARLKPPERSFIGVVDCVARTLGVNAKDTPLIRHVSSPVDLTGVGVRVGQLMDDSGQTGNCGAILCIDSVSTMLMYSNLQSVFRFLHVMAGRVSMRKQLGVYVMDEGMHDGPTIATLKQLFNAVLQVKVEDDRTYIRAIGLTPRPTKWLEYEVADDAARVRGQDQESR
jgi:KaiC/GvpD/RAD55 family RecA-like ATPase